MTNAQTIDEAAAAQRVPDKAPTTANLRQWVQQYALARQLAAERSKSEELALRCIQLENELAIERTRTSILHTAAKTQPGGHDSAQTCADMAEAAPSVSRPSSTRSSTIVDDCDDIARLHEELDIATMATTAANQRAERAEKALAQMKACAIYAVNALETATARAQELADAHSASSALNIELEQALDQKAKSLVAVSSALATANQALSDTQNELAAERRATSERAKADTPRTVDAGQRTDGRIVDLRTKNTRLDLDLGIMTRKFKDEQELKMFIIRKVRGWVEKSECRCSNQVGRREFLTWLRRTDN
ncbi:hypothetical protein H4R19_005878 [Coemansia spiralis]|nr:hypothetical protein H4R19_005878 [Coemansia spiralis]